MAPLTTILATWLSVLLTSAVVTAQELPGRKEEYVHFQMANPEVFHDTGYLPDGVQIRSYIFKDAESEKRYFFSVEEDNTPVSITVTPCSELLEWQLTLLPDEGSGEASGDGLEHFEEQMARLTRPDQSIPLLKSYKGYSRSSYVVHDSPAGDYMLVIKSLGADSAVDIHATTTPYSDQAYPELPSDPRLDITAFQRNTITLGWKSSPSEAMISTQIKYCITANTDKNFETLCGFQSYHSNVPPPALPRDFGFGFEHETEIRERHRQSRRRYKKRQKEIKDNDFRIECIGSKTQHTFTDLLPGKQYFFDLFAVNRVNNYSTSYEGASLKTRERQHHKVVDLKDGKVVRASVRKSNSPKAFRFRTRETVDKLMVTVHPCSSQVYAEIWKENEMIREMEVAGLRNFTLEDATPGVYLVKVSNSRRRSVSFKVSVTTRPSKYPYPRMPADTRVIEYDMLRSCDSVMLAWLGTKEKSHYCFYKREESEERRHQRLNTCHGPAMRKKTEKMYCRHYNTNEGKIVLNEQVTGLSPATTYKFDIYVDSYGAETLPYQSVWVTTKEHCN
ncbi:protein NDNF-like [Ptychodera flava]|uniref:protein NDNF-like n=1 Tax=Ptychodera flava TaxID=63121 RepID=UPI003969F5E5